MREEKPSVYVVLPSRIKKSASRLFLIRKRSGARCLIMRERGGTNRRSWLCRSRIGSHQPKTKKQALRNRMACLPLNILFLSCSQYHLIMKIVQMGCIIGVYWVRSHTLFGACSVQNECNKVVLKKNF